MTAEGQRNRFIHITWPMRSMNLQRSLSWEADSLSWSQISCFSCMTAVRWRHQCWCMQTATKTRSRGWRPPRRDHVGDGHQDEITWVTATKTRSRGWRPPRRDHVGDGHQYEITCVTATKTRSRGWRPPRRDHVGDGQSRSVVISSSKGFKYFHACYMSGPHPPGLDRPNTNNWCKTQMTRFCVTLFSPVTYWYLPKMYPTP
jgi:hypothetical protein